MDGYDRCDLRSADKAGMITRRMGDDAMKKTICFLLLCMIALIASGCGRYASHYKAVGFVHSNEAHSAFMTFFEFEGRMVFKLKCKDASAEQIRYTAELGAGSAAVYAGLGEEQTKLCDVSADDAVASVFRPLQNGTVYIVVETAGACENGGFHFDLERAEPEAATISEVDGGSLAYTAKVAYANYSGDARILSGALNGDMMAISSVQHLPVYKFETAGELQDFRTVFADALSFEHSYDEIPSFDHYATEYDDAFFQSRTLILCYVQASSGSYRYGIADVSVNGDSLCLYVKQLNHPEVHTCDMAGWFVLAEVSKADIESCKHFDAQMVDTHFLDSITADYDGDGETEEILLTYGPTSGLYTIGVTVRDGVEEYSNYFLPESFVDNHGLTVQSGKVCLQGEENGSAAVYAVSVENGRVVLTNGEKTMRYWGAEPEFHVSSYSNLSRKQGKEKTLSTADNQAVTQLIERQDFGDPYDNLNDVILTEVLNEFTVYYDSGAGIVTRGDFAVKLSDADRETLNGILSRYVRLGVE